MYSIKTDLGISGNATVNKDLLVNGNAVVKGNLQVDGTVKFANATFTQITVTGPANLADINSTGTSNLKDINVSGNTVLGTTGTNTLTVKAASTFAAPITAQNNITQTNGSTTLKATSVDSLTVAGLSNLNGNLVMGNGTTATMKSTVTDSLTVNGNSTFTGTVGVTGKATFQDVEINGNLTGAYTIATGNFNNIKVTGLSELNNVSISGATSLTGNVTGSNITAYLGHVRIMGSTGILDFSYQDPARPTDTVSSVEPYQMSTTLFKGKNLVTDSASIGKVDGSTGLKAIGKASIDYLNITGNGTIGDQPQLQVAGKTILTGKTTVGDLEITGDVSGLTFSDIVATSLTVNGATQLNGSAQISGNLNGTSTSQVAFPKYTVGVGAGTQNDIIQFAYHDATNNIVSSISPYKIASSVIQANSMTSDTAVFGKVDSTMAIHGLGKSTIDYLYINGNSTIGVSQPQLQVTGKSVLHDVDFTGTVTGLNVDVSGQALNPASVTSAGAIKGNTLESVTTTKVGTDLTVGGKATIKDLVVTGTVTGITVDANVDGLNIKPATVAATGDVSGATLTTTGLAKVGSLESGSAKVTNNVAAGSVTTVGDVVVGGKLTVNGTFDLGDIDLAVKSITATNASTLPILNSTTANLTNVNASTVSATGSLSGASSSITGIAKAGTFESSNIQAGASGAGTVTIASNAVAAKDFTVNGVFKPVGGLDLSTVDIEAKSLTTTGDVTVGGSINLSNADISALSFVSTDTTKVNTFPKLSSTDATVTNLTSSTINVSGVSTHKRINATDIHATSLDLTGDARVANVVAGVATASSYTSSGTTVEIAKNTNVTGSLNVTGTLTAGTIDLSGTDVSVKSLNSLGDTHVAGDLTVDGQFDLSGTNLQAATLKSTGITTVGTDLVLTTGNVVGSPKISGTLNVTGKGTFVDLESTGVFTAKAATVTGVSTLGVVNSGALTATTLTSTGLTKANTLEVTGISTLNGAVTAKGNLTVEGTLTPTGGLNLGSSTLEVAGVTTTGAIIVGSTLDVATNATVTGTLKVSGQTTLAATKVGTLSVDNGASITSGNLIVTSGNINQAGPISGTATLQKTTVTQLHVGSSTWDTDTYIAEVAGAMNITGNLIVGGEINANINLTGRDIKPRGITTSSDVVVGGKLTVNDQATMPSAIIGAASSTNNNLQINGNTVCTGDFTVQGRIIGTLDQTTSDITVKSVTATTFVKGNTLEVATTSNLKGKVTVSAGGVDVTGGTSTDYLAVSTTSVFTGKITANGSIATTGGVTSDTITTSGLVKAASLEVTGASTFTGLATAVNLTSTGLLTAKDVTITGTLTADIADLVTSTISTKKYSVIAAQTVSVAGGSSWTPDGSSNVYNLTLTGSGGVTIGKMPIETGKAASWFIYITQGATGQTVSLEPSMGLIGDSTINTTANSVSILQLVYCGVGTQIDVFVAQRNL